MRTLIALLIFAFTLLSGCKQTIYHEGVVISKEIEAGHCTVRLQYENNSQRSFIVYSSDYALTEVGDRVKLYYNPNMFGYRAYSRSSR